MNDGSEEFHFPGLPDEIFPEAVMGLFVHEAESSAFVDAVGRSEDALCP